MSNDSYQKVMPVTLAGGNRMINSSQDDGDGDDDSIEQDEELAEGQGIQLTEEDLEALKKAAEDQRQRKEDMYSGLARDIEAKLSKRMGTRKAKENQWLESMRMYLGSLSSYNIVTGEYPFGTNNSPSSGNDQAATHRPEFNIIRQKCNIAIAQTVAYQFAAGDKNWNLRTPQVIDLDRHDMQVMIQSSGNPNISPQQAAELKTDLMEREIENHLTLTNYALEARKAKADRVILGTGVLKGPFNAGKMKRVYAKQQTADGTIIRVPTYTYELQPLIYRVNLWYWFPDDSVTEVEKAADSIEVHPYNKADLIELMRHKGYLPDQIAPCLEEEPRQYTNSPFNDPAYLTQGINLLKDKYLVLEYHGPIKKCDLEVLGVDSDDSPIDEVYGEIWVCNSRVIRLQLSTIEGCNKIPYNACVWEPDPATIYGFSVPMLSRDQQRVVNETYKMVLDNAGISAGPQVVVDTTIISPAEGGLECTPWKVWYAKEYGADMTKAILFFTPTNSFEQLASLITMARGFADEESSIQLLSGGGSNPTGAGDSATESAIFNENALSPLFFKSEEWDDHVTHPLLLDMYDWEMQYNPKEEIKGTYDIDVRSSTAYLKGVMDQQRLDRLFQEISQGSPVAEYINMDELVAARLAVMKLPFANIVKSQQQLAADRQAKAQQPPPPDPNMIKAQAAQQANEIAAQRLQLENQRLQFDQQKHSNDINMQSQIQQDTNQSKIAEHQLEVQRTQTEAGARIAEAQAQIEVAHTQLDAQLHTTGVQEQTKKQIAGLKHGAHQQTLQVQQQKIAADSLKSRNEQEMKLHVARVNADTKTRQGREEVPNRDISRLNPKPT